MNCFQQRYFMVWREVVAANVGLKDLEQYSLAHPGGDNCALRLAYCQCLLSYDYAPVEEKF